MRQICYLCGVLFGVKEPLEDDSETHGLCDECFPIEMKRLGYELENLKKTDLYKEIVGQRDKKIK